VRGRNHPNGAPARRVQALGRRGGADGGGSVRSVDLVVGTALLLFAAAWTVSRLLVPEIRRGLPGTRRRLAVWALVVLLFVAVGAPGMPLTAVKVIDVVLWTAMGAVVVTVAGHHLGHGRRASRGRRSSAQAPDAGMPHGKAVPAQTLPWPLRAQRPLFWLMTGGVSRPSDLIRWSLLVAVGYGCLEACAYVDLGPLSVFAAMLMGLGVVLLEISLAVQAWSIWQNRGRRA